MILDQKHGGEKAAGEMISNAQVSLGGEEGKVPWSPKTKFEKPFESDI